MSNWGISPNASEKEKIKADYADILHGMNSTGAIPYDVYSDLFDEGMELFDRMYEQGKADEAEPVKHGWWEMRGGRRYCSVCNHRANYTIDTDDFWYTVGTNFCAECGAKMDLEVSNDES